MKFSWKRRERHSSGLFGFKDEGALGRTCMLVSATMEYTISWLSSGLFYTSFLMINGIDIVNIGIITFVPYIASCFSVFSPSILERFQRRKAVLAVARGAVYALNILGITVLPNFVHDPSSRVVWFVVIVFAANIINGLFRSGYSVWHVNFIPEKVRANYFSVKMLVQSFIGCGTALVSSIIADALAGSAYEETIILIFRYAAFLMGMLDVFFLCLPKEYPYARTAAAPRLHDIIVKPFGQKKFLMTMGIVFVYTFCANVPASALNYYLLNDVGVEYTFVYTINMFYPFFLLAFLPLWKRILGRLGWFRTFAWTELALLPTNLLYSFIASANYFWLMPTVRLTQHFFGVGHNMANENMVFINLPKADQTNYVSFHTLVTNIAAFLGMMAGTGFVAAFPDLNLTIGSFAFTNVQVLLWVQVLGELLLPLFVFRKLPQLNPDEA